MARAEVSRGEVWLVDLGLAISESTFSRKKRIMSG